MSKTIKDIDLKYRTYYFFNDMINIKNFDANYIKKVKSHTKIFLFTTFNM